MGVPGAAAYDLAQTIMFRPLSIPYSLGIGNSYAEGSGETNHALGSTHRVGRAVGAKKCAFGGYAGAVLCHASLGTIGDGGVFWILNSLQSNNGAFGGVAQVSKADSGWGPRQCHVTLDYWLNDLGQLGLNNTPMIEAGRTVMAGLCRSQLFHVFAGAAGYVWTRTGTWATSNYGNEQALQGGCYESSTVGSKHQIQLPANMPAGRVIHFGYVVLPTDIAVATIEQVRSGSTIASMNYIINGSVQCDPATGRGKPGNGVVCRTGLKGDGFNWQGGDTVVVTVSSVSAGAVRYNYMGVEAEVLDGPVMTVALPTRLPASGYAFYAVNFAGNGAQGANMNDAVIDAGVAALKGLCAEFPNRAIPVDFSDLVDTRGYPLGSYANDGNITSGPLAGQKYSFHPNNDFSGKRAQRMIEKTLGSGYLTNRVAAAYDGAGAEIWYSIGGRAAYGASSFLGTPMINGWVQYNSSVDNGSYAYYPGYTAPDANGQIRLRGRVSGGTLGMAIAQISQFGTMMASKRFSVVAGIDDVQTLSGSPTGGTFKLTIAETGTNYLATTASIAWNATAAQVQSAIFAAMNSTNFPDVEVLPVTVAGSLGAGMTLTFNMGLGGKPMTVTVDNSALTGGTISVAHTITGSMFTIPLEITGGAYTNAGQGNYLIPRYTGTVSWIDLAGATINVDA